MHRSAETAKEFGRDGAGGAIGAVGHDAQPVERKAGTQSIRNWM